MQQQVRIRILLKKLNAVILQKILHGQRQSIIIIKMEIIIRFMQDMLRRGGSGKQQRIIMDTQ